MSSDLAVSRKDRERHERERMILDEAEQLLIEEGYLGLKMDTVAKRIGYAKGTIYQHFSSKEDMLLGLTAQRKQRKAEWFLRAAAFQGRTRERMAAVGVADRIFRRTFPQHLENEHLLLQHSIWEKTSDSQRNSMNSAGHGCETAMKAILGDAMIAGDLKLNERQMADMILGLRGLSMGVHLLAGLPGEETSQHLCGDPLERLAGIQHRLLDTYGWEPLSDAWDWTATHQRIVSDCFPAEAAACGLTE